MDENSIRELFEASRLSYQIGNVHRYSPSNGNCVVDVHGESLGVTTGVALADRYRIAVANAKFDGGVRALCTSGQSCNTVTQCGFCPSARLRPFPVDGHDQFPSAVMQARRLWNVRLDEIIPSGTGPEARFSSLGAMMLAAHVQGHNCLSSAFDGVFPTHVPHEIDTLSGVASWAKALKYKPNSQVLMNRFLLVLRIRDSNPEASIIGHVFPVVVGSCKLPISELSVEYAGYVMSVQVLTYERALQASALSVTVDVGYQNILQNECILPTCHSMPAGYEFCSLCGFVVKSDGHLERCRPAGRMVTMELVYARAQFGDVYHTQDVLHALIDRKVPSSERTVRLAEYKAGVSQAAFMRFAGYEGSDTVLATWFEACYDYFRSYYWEVTFESDPPFPIILISDLHPDRLDPRPMSQMPIVPDYRLAWNHILKVSSPVGKVLLDDPVRVAVRAARQGQFEAKARYTSRYTKLPPPTRFCIKPITGARVYDNNAFLEVAPFDGGENEYLFPIAADIW